MKKTLLSLISAVYVLNASPTSLVEVSPDSYGKQAFTLAVDSYGQGYDNLTIKDMNIGSSDIGITLANKATLKNFGYQKGEMYWRGSGEFNLGQSQPNMLLVNLATGVSLNLRALYVYGEVFGGYKSVSGKSDTSSTTTIQTTPPSVDSFPYGASVGFGIPLGKLEVGLGYERTYGKAAIEDINQVKINFKTIESGFVVPVTYSLNRSIKLSMSYRSSNLSASENNILGPQAKTSKALIGLTWIYNN
jgi:hypothetical protein